MSIPRRHVTLIFTALVFLSIFFAVFKIVHADPPACNDYDQRGCAQGGFVPLSTYSDSPKLQDIYSNTSGLSNFLNKLFFAAISLGAILAVLRLAWAGFLYMTSDLPGNKGKAKEIIQDTLLGLFLLLGIWLILYQINPHILDLNVNVSQQSQAPGGGTANPFNTNGGN